MKTIRTSILLTMVTFSGCASAYNCYEGCSVPCKYCPPAPLAYSQFCGNPCHSNAAEPYLWGVTRPAGNPVTPAAPLPAPESESESQPDSTPSPQSELHSDYSDIIALPLAISEFDNGTVETLYKFVHRL